MKEKKKRGQSIIRRFAPFLLRAVVVVMLFCLLIVGVCLYWAYSGYVKSSLDSQYTDEAIQLYSNPRVVAPKHFDEYWMYFHIQLNRDSSDFESYLCFDVMFIDEQDFNNLRWTELIINKQVVRRSLEEWRYSFVVLTLPAHSRSCIYGKLDEGYHIIEFRVKDSPFSEPYYVRQSAILIE